MMRISFTKVVTCVALSMMLSTGNVFAQSKSQKSKISGQILGWTTSYKLSEESSGIANQRQKFVTAFKKLKSSASKDFFVKEFTNKFGAMLDNKDSAFNTDDKLRLDRRLVLMIAISDMPCRTTANFMLKHIADKDSSFRMLAWKGIDNSSRYIFKLTTKSRNKFIDAFAKTVSTESNPFVLEAAYNFARISEKAAKSIKKSAKKKLAKAFISAIAKSRENACKVMLKNENSISAQAMATAVKALSSLSSMTKISKSSKTELVKFTLHVACFGADILSRKAAEWKKEDANTLNIPAFIELITASEKVYTNILGIKEKANSELAKEYKGNKDEEIEYSLFKLNLQDVFENLKMPEPKVTATK